MQLYESVVAIIVKELGVSQDDVTPQTNLVKDLGINSLELVELACCFEQEFNTTIHEQDIRRITKVCDIVTYLETKV